MTMPLLEMTDLRCQIHGQLLWQIEELAVPASGNLLLRGANGAGKTLLLKTLAGLEQPVCQSLRLQGMEVKRAHRQQRLRAATVYVHSQPWMFARTVQDNIAYGLRQQGLRGALLGERVWKALEWASLQDLAGQQARRLSSGQQRRLAITRARALCPDLLLLDEPLNGLDQGGRKKLLQLLDRLVEEQHTVLWTSHEEVADAGQVDELWQLEDGQLSRELRHGSQATAVVSFRRSPSQHK